MHFLFTFDEKNIDIVNNKLQSKLIFLFKVLQNKLYFKPIHVTNNLLMCILKIISFNINISKLKVLYLKVCFTP